MTPPPPELPSLAAVGTRDRLAGHVGHLSPDQEAALTAFKTKLSGGGYFTPAADGKDASHDDATLLRFLRARNFGVDGAYAQFTASEEWRKKNHVEKLYDEYDVPEFTYSQSVYPQWTGRRDKAGLPVFVFKIGGLSKEVINKYSKVGNARLDERMIALYEFMVQFLLPFCSSVPRSHEETPISATTTIVDISNVSLGRFWALRSHMQRASTLATANYAETLGTIYIVGAPNFFSVVWGWIGKWFDPHTVEKIFILPSHEVLPTLSRFIEPENIPKGFGGQLDWEYGHSDPNLDAPAKETMGLEKLPQGPVRWINGEIVVKGSGRKDGDIKPVHKKSATGTGSEIISPNGTPKVETPSTPVIGTPSASSRTPSVMSEDVEPTEEEIQKEHDIWAAARAEPAAPVKELAAVLEGTTL